MDSMRYLRKQKPDPYNNDTTTKDLSLRFSGEKGWLDIAKRITDAEFETFSNYPAIWHF